jgi:hypothetical protein
MITIEDLKHFENTFYNLDKLCYRYFSEHSTNFENYNSFELGECGNIIINYWFINYLDETDNGEMIVSFEELIRFCEINI